MYEIYLPAEVRHVLQNLQVVISLGVDGVPLACVGAIGYFARLLFWFLAPLAIVACGTAAILIHSWCAKYVAKGKAPAPFIETFAPFVLRVIFLT